MTNADIHNCHLHSMLFGWFSTSSEAAAGLTGTSSTMLILCVVLSRQYNTVSVLCQHQQIDPDTAELDVCFALLCFAVDLKSERNHIKNHDESTHSS